jgi:peptidoglycan/LPS O-acetylase OafA/YrhL
MKLHPMFRRALAVIAVVLLLYLAWEGIRGGVTQWSQSNGTQRVQVASQAAFGVGALLVVASTFWRRRWLRFAELGFSIACAAAASLAAVVWGEQSILYGVFAGFGALVIALALIWMLRVGVRAPDNRGELT